MRRDEIPALEHGCNSWVIIRRDTGEGVCELYEIENVMKFDSSKVIVKSAHTYLCDLNESLRRGS